MEAPCIPGYSHSSGPCSQDVFTTVVQYLQSINEGGFGCFQSYRAILAITAADNNSTQVTFRFGIWWTSFSIIEPDFMVGEKWIFRSVPQKNIFSSDARTGCKVKELYADEQFILYFEFQEFVMVHSAKLTEFNRGSEPEGWIPVYAISPLSMRMSIQLKHLNWRRKEGADAITLIERPASATAVEDRVKHGRIHLVSWRNFRERSVVRSCCLHDK